LRFLNGLKRIFLTILTVLFFCLPLIVAAQKHTKPLNLPKLDRRPIHFGFHLGLNTMTFGLRPVGDPAKVDTVYSMEVTPQNGFTMGILGNFRLHDLINVRILPTLSFGQRTVTYTVKGIYDTAFYNIKKPVESTYLELPVILRFKSARLNNYRVYLDTGMKYGFDLSSKAGTDDKGESLLKIKRHDVSFELGVGLDVYLQYFKFSPSLRCSWGIPNIHYRENHMFSAPLDRIYSRMVLVTFYFEGSL
jgi:hypothetical protein